MEVNYNLRAYHEVADSGHAGTPERWVYLGDVRAELRARMIRDHRRLVHEITERERRVLDVEREVALASRKPPTTRLAEL